MDSFQFQHIQSGVPSHFRFEQSQNIKGRHCKSRLLGETQAALKCGDRFNCADDIWASPTEVPGPLDLAEARGGGCLIGDCELILSWRCLSKWDVTRRRGLQCEEGWVEWVSTRTSWVIANSEWRGYALHATSGSFFFLVWLQNCWKRHEALFCPCWRVCYQTELGAFLDRTEASKKVWVLSASSGILSKNIFASFT